MNLEITILTISLIYGISKEKKRLYKGTYIQTYSYQRGKKGER